MKEYTLSGVWRYLKRAGIGWRSAFLRQWSPDPEYQSKLEHLCACFHEAGLSPGGIELIFMDEAGFNRWPTTAKVWAELLRRLHPVPTMKGTSITPNGA